MGCMGTQDLRDVSADGKTGIAEKGWMALGKTPPSPCGSVATAQENSTPESPEHKYERWLSGKAKEVSKERTVSEPRNEAGIMGPDSYTELIPRARISEVPF